MMQDSATHLAAAATLEPAAEQLLRAQISDALRVQSARPYAASPQAAALAFETIVSELCTAAVATSDAALYNTIASSDDVHDALLCASRLQLLPSSLEVCGKWLPIEHLRGFTDIALAAAANELERSRDYRQNEIGQRLLREVLRDALGERLQLSPASFARPDLTHSVLSEAHVARLRAGEALILDPQLACLSANCMRMVQADLTRLVLSVATPSLAPCNAGSLSANIPLPPPHDSSSSSSSSHDGSSSGLCRETTDVLHLLAALAAEIERHGWPRGKVRRRLRARC